jgi:hypothetical protein
VTTAGSREIVAEAVSWVLTNGSDLLPHLVSRDVHLAAYVGRRFDQSWRAAEFRALQWIHEDARSYQEPTSRDLAEARELVADLRARPDDPAEHLSATLDLVEQLYFRLGSGAPDAVVIRMTAPLFFASRLAISLFRLSKHQWFEAECAASRWPDPLPYQWLEL